MPSTGAWGSRVRAAAAAFGHGGRGTTTGWPTGAPGARKERTRPARRYACAPRAAPLRVPAFVLPGRVRGRAGRAGPLRLRGARDAGRAVALRVPPARARVRGGAGADAAPPPRRAQRDRRPEARARRGDLRAGA